MKKYLITALLVFLPFILSACDENGNVQESNHQTIDSDENDPVSQNTENNLSDLRTPYVGAAHSVQAIVNELPLPTSDWNPDMPFWNVSSIEIGQNFGDFSESHAPYTLMILYDAIEGFFTTTTQQTLLDASHVFKENAEWLFELIENLQTVTFALNIPVWSEDGDFPIFEYRWSRSRSGEISITSPPIEEMPDR